MVDDRGLPLTAPVRVCWTRDLVQDCSEVAPGAPARWPDRCDSLRIEGTEHGPAVWTPCPSDLPRGELALPRKARLALSGLPAATRGTLSLYAVADEAFRRPAYRFEVTAPRQELRIPAGDWLSSLSVAANAPDLSVIAAPPGGSVTRRYQAHSGWSALLRITDQSDGSAIERAEVRLHPALVAAGPSSRLRALSSSSP